MVKAHPIASPNSGMNTSVVVYLPIIYYST